MNKQGKGDFLKREIISYFEDINFEYWAKRLSHISLKLRKLKTNKARSPYLIDCYSVYLQLLEIFFINILSLSFEEKNFFRYLFISNVKLRKCVEDNFLSLSFQRRMMEDYVFGIKDKHKIKEYNKLYTEHIKIIKECVKDYLEDYDFLNAYKHGFRAKALFGNMKVGVGGYQIFQGDSQITYYSQKDNHILKCNIIFSHKRILVKSFFIVEMLKNAQKVFLAQGEKKRITLNHHYIKGVDDWKKSFGTARFKTEIL